MTSIVESVRQHYPVYLRPSVQQFLPLLKKTETTLQTLQLKTLVMDPLGNPESLAINSTNENCAQGCEHKGSGMLSEETYCSDQLNISGNSCDCTGYFEMPECVMDTYLLAIDGGDESNAALRQISDVYGPKDDGTEINSNCNHNPEPDSKSGCGCNGSYNSKEGCSDCGDSGSPYEDGFKDKKREGVCKNCEYETYQRSLKNKTPMFVDNDYGAYTHLVSNQFVSTDAEDAYQQPLANKKPHSADQYMIPNRSTPRSYNISNNNSNAQLAVSARNTKLAQLKQLADYTRPVHYSHSSNTTRRKSDYCWLGDLSRTTVLFSSERVNEESVDFSVDSVKGIDFIQNDLLLCCDACDARL